MPSSYTNANRPAGSKPITLGRELSGVLFLKVILLMGLWFLFFRHDPNATRPSVDAVFFAKDSPTATPSFPTPKETPHGIR